MTKVRGSAAPTIRRYWAPNLMMSGSGLSDAMSINLMIYSAPKNTTAPITKPAKVTTRLAGITLA